MYRQVIALFIHQHRPGHEVKLASPRATAEEVERFRPHLLVRNDDDGLRQEALEGVRFWVEVLYSDGMGARIGADGEVAEAPDVSMEDLLRVVDEAAACVG
jgi:hypothetical protein